MIKLLMVLDSSSGVHLEKAATQLFEQQEAREGLGCFFF
jgi:hypothetical protein